MNITEDSSQHEIRAGYREEIDRLTHENAELADLKAIPANKGAGFYAEKLRAATAEMLELKAEREGFAELERSYSRQLGRMAQLSDIVCSHILGQDNPDSDSQRIRDAATEIMEYVEAVRPPTP